MKTEYKYDQYCIPLTQSDCRYFFVLTVTYFKTGRADTLYCGKNNRGDKIYKSKHYLLWTIQDMVKLFNTENPLEKVEYYVIQQMRNI